MEGNPVKTDKLKLGTVTGYGIGAIGEGLGYNVFFSFFIFFLTTVAGIPPAIAGVISSVAVLWDAVTDPIIGNWSDTTMNKRGRRRPFIMTGSVLFGIAIALLFINIDMPMGAKTVYFIIINALYWVTLTSCVIPHISLGSELSDDFDERTKLRSCAVALMGIGTLIATSATLVLVNFYTELFGGSETAGWAGTGITYGVIVALIYNICCIIVKDKEPKNPNLKENAVREKHSLGESFSIFCTNAKKAFQNKALRILIIINFCVNIVVTLGGGLFVYILTYVYKYDDMKTSQVFLVQGILVILAALFAGYIANKSEKKVVMAGGVGVYALSFLLICVMPVSDITIYIVLVLYSIGNSSFWTMIYAMSYDSTIVEQIKTGDKPDGLYTSLIGLFMKFGNSLGSLAVGIGLQLVGFSADAAMQTESTVEGIRILYGVAPAVVLIIGFIVALRYPITKKKYNELLNIYNDKQAGKEIEKEQLDKLI